MDAPPTSLIICSEMKIGLGCFPKDVIFQPVGQGDAGTVTLT